jgi:hypothetical protein
LIGILLTQLGCDKPDQREQDFDPIAGQYQLLYTRINNYYGDPFHSGGSYSYSVIVADSVQNVRSVIIQSSGKVEFYVGYDLVFETSDFDYSVNAYFNFMEMDIYLPYTVQFGLEGDYSPFIVKYDGGRMTRSVSTGTSGESMNATEFYERIQE